jgi:nitrite reductase (cytochrome c-552)
VPNDAPASRGVKTGLFIGIVALTALFTAGITYLLITIVQRKQEARNPYVKLVDVRENTSDPAEWGKNWPRQYDAYLRTVDVTRTKYGGSEAMPQQKIDRDPWLRRMFAGYAFSIDYRDRRGHAYMLYDQEQTERVLQRPQSGACLHCHASVVPTYRRVGAQALGQGFDPNSDDFNWPAVMKGFEVLAGMNYSAAHAELLKTPDGSPGPARAQAGTPQGGPTTQQALAANVGEAHPVSCLDCHSPATMELRVTRPGFVRGIQKLARSNDPVPHLKTVERWRAGGRKGEYDPNADASRQEMRSFVCAQCHVEYYCATKEPLFFPWDKGLKVEQIEATFDEHKFPDGTPFMDYRHGGTGAPIYKAQHPEFELWSQGTHARAGVACADCHMPYQREGAMKVSDHWVRSPLLQINRACQQCHPVAESELLARATAIQDRTHHLMQRAGTAVVDMLDAIQTARRARVSDERLKPAFDLQRKAQWRLDFVAAENSMGFHAPPEAARILGEAIDYARQAQALAQSLHLSMPQNPATLPTTRPIEGVMPKDKAPPAPYNVPQ